MKLSPPKFRGYGLTRGAPKPGFPKTAAETAGETRGAGGSAGGTAAETASALRSRETALSPAVSAAVPPALPPSFPGSFRSSLRSSFGEFRLGGPVDGRGNRKDREPRTIIDEQRIGLFYGQLVFYSRLGLLLTVNWLGLFYLRLKVGLVFFAYGGDRFGLFCLRLSPCGNWATRQDIGFGLFYLWFPTMSRKHTKKNSTVSKKHPRIRPFSSAYASLCCKNMCCASRFARVVGELQAADQAMSKRPESKMLAQWNNVRLRDQGGSRGRSSTQDQKTRTVSTC